MLVFRTWPVLNTQYLDSFRSVPNTQPEWLHHYVFSLVFFKAVEHLLCTYLSSHRAFDVELLYIAQRFKIPIAEVAVNWTEIEGRFFMCPPTGPPICSSINISVGCVCKSVISCLDFLFLFLLFFSLCFDWHIYCFECCFPVDVSDNLWNYKIFSTTYLSRLSTAVMKIFLELLHGLSAVNVSKLAYFHYLSYKSIIWGIKCLCVCSARV